MNRRDRVIQVVEQARSDSVLNDPQQLIQTCIEEVNRDSWTNFRSKMWVFVLTLFVIFPIFFYTKWIGRPNQFPIPIWAVYAWITGGVFGVAWLWHRFPNRVGHHSISIHKQCTSCWYDLEGHSSVLGDAIWVGPEICPECGQTYPAIG